MFSFPGLAALPPGIQSLADVARWNPDAASEATEGAAALRSDSQILAECVEEALEGLPRAVFMLGPKGTPAQRCSVLRALDPLLLSDGDAAFDALLPPLQRLLCTWEPALQIQAAEVYATILDRAHAVAVECARRERAERSGASHLYDTPDGLPPPLPWVPGADRIERVILPTILLLADAEPGGATASAASRAAAASAAASSNSKSIARPADHPAAGGGGETAEEAASSWLHPLSLALSVLGATSAATPAVTSAGLSRALAFAMHKRDPTGSANSRMAAAKVFGFIAPQMQQQLVQDKLFSPLLGLCSDPNPHVRVCACQQLNCVTRAALGVASSAALSSAATPALAASSSYAASSVGSGSSYLHRALSELESLLAKDDSVDVKSAALLAIVDLLDVLPSTARRQRSIPLLKQLCTAASAAPPSGSAASAASSPSSKLMLNMLMRAFGPFLWKVSMEMQPPTPAAAALSSATGVAVSASPAAALSSASVAAASSSSAVAAAAAAAAASSSGDPEGPSNLRFFVSFFTKTVSAAYSSGGGGIGSTFALSSMAASVASQDAGGSSSASTSISSSASGASSISPDVELRRLAAFQLPAIILICVGGHCGTTSVATAGYSGGVSAPPSKVYSFTTGSAATASASSSSSPASSTPSFPAAPLSSSLSPRTLTLLEGLHALLLRMVSDPDVEVRRTVAASFHALSAHWPSDLLLRHLRDPYLSLMHVGKQGCAVVEAALANLEPVVDLFSAHKAEDPLAPMLAELLRCIVAYDAALGLNWRRRLALITQAGLCYPRLFALDPVSLHEKLVPLLFDTMRGSGGYPVKRAAVATLASFIKSFPYTYRRHELAARVTRELCSARTCHLRLLYCDLVLELFHRFSYRWLKKHIFAPFVSTLYKDPVAAVRRRFVDLLPTIKFALKSGSKEDRELWELFKGVVEEMKGEETDTGTATAKEGSTDGAATSEAEASATAPPPVPASSSSSSAVRSSGDSDPYVRAAARVLWSNMYAIEIHSEFDRLNRRKEAEEDALDRLESNLTINKELNAGSMAGAGAGDLSGSSAASTAAAAEAAKKKTSAFDRRRNHSVIVANTSREQVGGGAAAPLGSPLSPGVNSGVGGGLTGPLSARTMIRAKLGPNDSPPNSPGVFAGSADVAAKFSPRPRTGSVSSASSPTGSPLARPGSSAGSASSAAGFTPASPSTPTKPPTGSPVPSLKLRPRSHSVTATGSGDSSAASLREFQQQQLALRSFAGVREEEEDEGGEADEARRAATSDNQRVAPTVSPPKATASSFTPSANSTPPAAATAIPVVPAASLLPTAAIAATPPPSNPPSKGKSVHARRPSTLNMSAVSSITAAAAASAPQPPPQQQQLSLQSGSPLSPLLHPPMSVSAGTAAALSSLSPAGPLIHSLAKSPKPPRDRDRDGGGANALSSGSPLSVVPSLLLPSAPPSTAAQAQSARGDRSSIISALLRSHSQETGAALAPHAAPLSARSFSSAASDRGLHSYSSGAFANEPLSAPAHVSSMLIPASLSGGPHVSSMGLAGSRIRTHGPASASGASASGSLSARVHSHVAMSGLGAEEKASLFPKVSGATALSHGGPAASADLMMGMSPRVQRMNLHSAVGSSGSAGASAGQLAATATAASRSAAAASSFSPASIGARPRGAVSSPGPPSPSPPAAASPSSVVSSPSSASASLSVSAPRDRAKRSMLARNAAAPSSAAPSAVGSA